MKKSKVISLFLSLSLLASLTIPVTLASPTPTETEETPENSMVIEKTAEANEDGSYTITLEAYATGEKVSTEINKDVPTDIVLVLDQSGSMGNDMSSYEFRKYTNKTNRDYYDLRHNSYGKKNLYYLLGDGSYASVFVNRDWKSSTYTYTYTYTYTDKSGQTQTIGTSTGANTEPNFTFYERRETSTTTRLNALKTAVTNFTNSVKEKAYGADETAGTEDDINHRIAVVGFATGGYTNNPDEYPKYQNTEVFVGSSQYPYNINASAYYRDALQDMNTEQGYKNVIDSKNALAAKGATYPNFGLEMAKGILDANPVSEGEERNRVVILFTDGTPGWSGYEQSVALSAITEAKALKAAGVTVYSVGIFEGADATDAGNQYYGDDTKKANWFMQNVSSNNGTPQNPSYYLSASDANTLNSIFKQISDQIEEGGSSTTLDENAVIKDTISPYFQLPKGATKDDITLETYCYTSQNQWEKNNGAMGATATISGDQVSVTGFDFAENWCGTEKDTNGNTTYRGNKLVISFPVEVKDGFLGGNKVPTNTSAGIYKNADSKEPMFTFNKPTVDVAIKDITVTAEDKNVYLMGDLTAEQIKSGATVQVGNVALDLSKGNYGLEPWQHEYVDITVAYKYAENQEVADLKDLREDTTYTVEVTVSPTQQGTIQNQTGNGEGKINVFQPELTYKDSEVWYGDNVPTDFGGNLVSTVWKHGEQTTEKITMTGETPTLQFKYEPKSGVQDGKINTKQDIAVDVDVRVEGQETGTESLNDFIVFKHEPCSSACGWTELEPNNGNPVFLLHVKTCTLTVTKTGGAADEPYVFTILKDGKKYSEITITGNGSGIISELPVGTYTIQEDEGWSWRYDGTEGAAVTLNKDKYSDTIPCTNSKTKDYWLNGFSAVIQNIYGNAHE